MYKIFLLSLIFIYMEIHEIDPKKFENHWFNPPCFLKITHICPKVNVSVQLEFELTYFEIAVKHVSHYTIKTLWHKK